LREEEKKIEIQENVFKLKRFLPIYSRKLTRRKFETR